MYMKKVSLCLIGCACSIAYAQPPFEVLRTCVDNKPYNSSINMVSLDDEGMAEENKPNCEDEFDLKYNNSKYGLVTCQGTFYFIINNKKIKLKEAVNMSINPEIKPGNRLTNRSTWTKIDFDNHPYLCVEDSLSDSGVGAAHSQYYIIENAFDATLTPESYFYFFDKNIAPITSKTL